MRSHVAFVAALAVVFGVFAYFAISFVRSPLTVLRGPHEDLETFVARYRTQHPAQLDLNFGALYARGDLYEVLHPSLDLRLFRSDDAPSCSPEAAPAPPVDSWRTTKSATLNHVIAGEMPLPRDFFSVAPLIDENGESFAHRFLRLGPASSRTREWASLHLPFFRVSELSEVLERYHIQSREYATLGELSDENLDDLLRGTSLIIADSVLLVRDTSVYSFPQLYYKVYDLRELQSELRRAGEYEIAHVEAGVTCLERSGHVCWTYDSTRLIAGWRSYSIWVLVVTALVFFAFLALYARYLFERGREERKHRLALQVLSHEFRTPVASLLVMLERLRETSMDAEVVARAGSEIYRLQRIVEVSRAYLQTTGHRLRFQDVEISSVNEWVGNVLHDAGYEVRLIPLSEDRAIQADPFWLRFILSNLVQNALAHGRAPVTVRLEVRAKKLWLAVEDEGECEFGSLGEMTSPFVKCPRSKGLGLGLNIVSFVAEEWGRDFRFATSPTTFSLAIGEER